MTTLYKPVQITSAEQAEALPLDTLAIEDQAFACQKLGVNEWAAVGGEGTWGNLDMVGWTALVPIEAEEVDVVGFGTGRTRIMLAVPREDA